MALFTRHECTTCCDACILQELVSIKIVRAIEGDPESKDELVIRAALTIQDDNDTAKGDLVCHGCICTMFINAIEDESNYPPQWAGFELKLANFASILGGFLATSYKMKIVEYKIKWDDRVYCTSRGVNGIVCGKFIGEKSAHPLRKYCFDCGTSVCMCCKDHIVPLVPHKCDGNALADEKDFKGLTKGKEWQKCPRCHNKFELRDGCNHIICAVCKESLCFICGAPAAANSNHWCRSGGSRCPRYNQPGTPNAMFEEDAIALAFPELFQDIPRPPAHIPNRGAFHAEQLRRERLVDVGGGELLTAEDFFTAQEFLTAMPAPPPPRAIERAHGGDATAQPPAPDRVHRQRVTGPVHIAVGNGDINAAARSVNPIQPRRNRVFNLLTNRTARENAMPNAHANMPLPPRHRQASQPQPAVQTQRFNAHPAIRLANRTQQQTQLRRSNAVSNVAVVNEPLNGLVHGHHHRGQHGLLAQAQTQQEHTHAHHRVQQQAQEARTHAHHRGRHPQLTEPQLQAENEDTNAQPQEDVYQPLPRNPSLDFTFRFPRHTPDYSQNRHFTIIGAGTNSTLTPNPLNTPPPPRGNNLMAVNQTIHFRHPDLTGA
ncbi:hypothetical protein M409DRAFT_18192 [Zasmidium cellare ATCC 36951]|uniref:RING-type domain-containing protein n=1 Tax=Zasmidium cellare ATCC 36951 TaxID=1080233 RepID=A0A6A6CXZ2_ZASCE|nr:uncharacterized protein M409DRAFT_18192 [Zasmidium cellare ATCC 36951]KAF2171961.1 hypothetical protein M409DRAFT_18192 [Zasmidium cellare ATCC 36951]